MLRCSAVLPWASRGGCPRSAAVVKVAWAGGVCMRVTILCASDGVVSSAHLIDFGRIEEDQAP